MFIILSQPRSGSTLLVECLNAHPEILIPDETDFIVPIAWLIDTVPNPDIGRQLAIDITINSTRFAHSLGELLTASEVDDAIRSTEYSVSAIVRAIYAKISNKFCRKFTGDKSPNHIGQLGILLKTKAFNNINIIHLVRDPRDVLSSIYKLGWGEGNYETMVPRTWNNSNMVIHDNLSKLPNYIMIRYEDLVRDPSHHLERLTTFLGTKYNKRMLDPTERRQSLRQMAQHTNIFHPISPQWIGGWKNVTDIDFTHCMKIAAEGMLTFGYTEQP